MKSVEGRLHEYLRVRASWDMVSEVQPIVAGFNIDPDANPKESF